MGSQGGPAPRRGRAAPPISSSPWLLQREGKHPLSCTSYSLPPAEDPQLIPSGDQGLDSSAQGVLHVSVSAHHAQSVGSHCAFDKVFLRCHPAERLMGAFTGIRQALLSSAQVHLQRENVGVTGLPRKVQGTEELVSCIWPSALALFPTCRVFQLCLVARLTHPGFRLTQLIGEAGDPCQPAQSKSSGDGM